MFSAVFQFLGLNISEYVVEKTSRCFMSRVKIYERLGSHARELPPNHQKDSSLRGKCEGVSG